MKTALFIRLDRMGDLVLTLPCDSIVSENYKVHWLVPKGLEFVVDSASPKKEYRSVKKDFSWFAFFELVKWIRSIKPEVSVSFHVPWWVNMALWMAGVKTRGGVKSQWHSYLFLNKALRQKRSRCEFHEMEYNYLLVEHTFSLAQNKESWKPVKLIAPEESRLQFDFNQKYMVVHPGMGGSALNWPIKNYATLINKLTEHCPVVITGTKNDEPYLNPLKKSLKDNHRVVWLDKQLDGFQLLKLLENASATIAPSTGVLHLSASLGVASLGLYSPILVHQAKRWGPMGEETVTFSPQVDCPAQFECLLEACPHYYCMDNLSVNPIAEKALSYL